MGLFSSSKEIHVATSSVKLLEDVPELTKQSIKASILSVDGDIVPNLVDNALNGLGVKARQMYNYARDHYTYGLPNGTIESYQVTDSMIQAAIQKDTGKQVYVALNIRSACNPVYWAYEFLKANRSWNPENDIVTNPPEHSDKTVYFDFADTLADSRIRLTYYYMDQSVPSQKVQFSEDVTTISPMVQSKDYYHVIYQEKEKEFIKPEQFYWFYELGSNRYPELETVYSVSEGSPYLPIVPLRLDNRSTTTDTSTEFYKTANLVLKKVGLNLRQLADDVEGNPDIGDIDFAYVIFGCHVKDNSQPVMRYLQEYFSYLHDKSAVTKADYDYWLGSNNQLPAYNTIRYSEANLDWSISYLYTTKEIKDEVIGKGILNECSVEFVPNSFYSILGVSFTDDVLRLKRQISKTQVEVVEVAGLNHTSHVYQGKSVDISIRDAWEGNDDEGFVIPVNLNVANNLGIIKMHDLMNHSMRIVFNCYEEVKLKWYQTGIFKIVTVIVSVVIAVWTGQWQAVVAAVSAGIIPLVITIARAVITNILIKTALTAIAKQINPKLAVLIAAVAVLYGFTAETLPSGLEAIQITDLATHFSSASIDAEMQDLMTEISVWGEQAQEMMGELEEMQDELYQPDLNLAALVTQNYRPLILPESWDRYYSRNIDIVGNSMSSLNSIEDYVEMNVQTPTIYETLYTDLKRNS